MKIPTTKPTEQAIMDMNMELSMPHEEEEDLRGHESESIISASTTSTQEVRENGNRGAPEAHDSTIEQSRDDDSVSSASGKQNKYDYYRRLQHTKSIRFGQKIKGLRNRGRDAPWMAEDSQRRFVDNTDIPDFVN